MGGSRNIAIFFICETVETPKAIVQLNIVKKKHFARGKSNV